MGWNLCSWASRRVQGLLYEIKLSEFGVEARKSGLSAKVLKQRGFRDIDISHGS